MSSLEDQTSTLIPVNMAYIACATIGILVITPGIALLYSTKKTLLTLAVQAYLVTSLVFIQWYLFGFSLANVPSKSVIIGNFKVGALNNIGAAPLFEGGTIPAIEYFAFSGFFPVCTVQIFLGSIVDRGRMLPSLIIGLLFTTIVYCPTAYWTWSTNGWLYKLGSDDLAGGGPVHVSAGVASLVYSYYLGRRLEWKKGEKCPQVKAYNPILNFIGAILIHYPWLFFNSGTPGDITNVRTLYIFANTQLASSFAMVTFAGIDYAIKRKWSLMAVAEGSIVGLVFITPACGFLEPWAVAIGSIITAAICRSTYNIAEWMGIDDVTHSFNVHGIGGIVASILLGVFSSPTIAGYDGVTEIKGGWIFHHWAQMGYQIAGTAAIVGWTVFFTYILCFIVDHIPGLKLRCSPEQEMKGLDWLEVEETKDVEAAMSFPELKYSREDYGNIEYLQAEEAGSINGIAGQAQPSSSYELQDIKQPLPQ